MFPNSCWTQLFLVHWAAFGVFHLPKNAWEGLNFCITLCCQSWAFIESTDKCIKVFLDLPTISMLTLRLSVLPKDTGEARNCTTNLLFGRWMLYLLSHSRPQVCPPQHCSSLGLLCQESLLSQTLEKFLCLPPRHCSIRSASLSRGSLLSSKPSPTLVSHSQMNPCLKMEVSPSCFTLWGWVEVWQSAWWLEFFWQRQFVWL